MVVAVDSSRCSVPLPDETLIAIERIVASQPTLEEVTRWALAQKWRNARDFEVVVQDEYTHDVVIPWNRERTLFLVYDTT